MKSFKIQIFTFPKSPHTYFHFPSFCSYLTKWKDWISSFKSSISSSKSIQSSSKFQKKCGLWKLKTPNFKCWNKINSQPQNLPMCWKNLSTLSTEFSKNREDSLLEGHPLLKFQYFQKYYRRWTTQGAHFETYQKWKISPAMSYENFKKWNNFL